MSLSGRMRHGRLRLLAAARAAPTSENVSDDLGWETPTIWTMTEEDDAGARLTRANAKQIR